MDYLEQAIRQACDKGMLQHIDIVSSNVSEKAMQKIAKALKLLMHMKYTSMSLYVLNNGLK